DHEHARAVLRLDHAGAATGRAGGKVDRTQEPGRALDEHQRPALIPGMVAAGDYIGAGVDQILVDRLGNAEAACRVLAVDGDEIELPVADQPGQALEHNSAPAAADDVSDEQDSHARSGIPEIDHVVLG